MENHIPATDRVMWPFRLLSRRAPNSMLVKRGESMDLGGKLLIAMPGMGDQRFEKSVIFLCAHSSDGAMGLVLNKVASDLSFNGLLDQLDIPHGPEGRNIRVHFGGPVERARGFVLHSRDYASDKATMKIAGGYGMTATTDILEALAQGAGPRSALLTLGYAGWGPGQLEAEIMRNDWLTCDATSDLVFSENDRAKWGDALRLMGIDPVTLSSSSGRA